jgi:hypothetical protein
MFDTSDRGLKHIPTSDAIESDKTSNQGVTTVCQSAIYPIANEKITPQITQRVAPNKVKITVSLKNCSIIFFCKLMKFKKTL